MGVLEIVLIILVCIWTLIFFIFGIAMVIILKGLKQSIDRINNILESAENITQVLNTPAKAAASAAGAIIGLVDRFTSGKNSPKKVKTVK